MLDITDVYNRCNFKPPTELTYYLLPQAAQIRNKISGRGEVLNMMLILVLHK